MSSQPPRFVPTLTEVVQPATAPVPAAEPPSVATVDSVSIENQLVQRVLLRVDLVLERRLREALGQLILEHTERLAPQLREEIEAVVRQSVSDAFAQELENDKKTSGV
jgi:hypothetical protein